MKTNVVYVHRAVENGETALKGLIHGLTCPGTSHRSGSLKGPGPCVEEIDLLDLWGLLEMQKLAETLWGWKH